MQLTKKSSTSLVIKFVECEATTRYRIKSAYLLGKFLSSLRVNLSGHIAMPSESESLSAGIGRMDGHHLPVARQQGKGTAKPKRERPWGSAKLPVRKRCLNAWSLGS